MSMRPKNIVPLFCTPLLAESRDFYSAHLGFRVYFEKENAYVGLRSVADQRCRRVVIED